MTLFKKIRISKSSLFGIFFILFVSGPIYGQGQIPEVVESEIAGVSQARLDRYEAFLRKEIVDGRIPGAISYVMRKGQVVHKEAFGYSSLKEKTPIKQDQIVHIMSMTKPIITVAFMMLYEEGHFSLKDPVSNYLPQFKDLKVAKDVNEGIKGGTKPANKEVTILQVLSHTAGFSHGLGGTTLDNEIAQELYFKPQKDIESRVNTMLSLPLVGHPGEQWYYSASPDVLSLLIEHFSGMTAAEFLQKRLFSPLGMKHTGYNVKKEHEKLWMPVHNKNKEGILVNSPQQLPIVGNTVYGGSHGLFSTAADYMTFCQMLLNNGEWKGRRYLSRKTLELMTKDHVGDLYQAPGQGFGLGFGVTTDLADGKATGSVGQYYWGGAYCTYFFIDPKEELISILITQLQPYSNYYSDKMRQFVYQAIID